MKEIRGISWQRRCHFFLKRNRTKVHTIKQKVGGEEWRLGPGPGDELLVRGDTGGKVETGTKCVSQHC